MIGILIISHGTLGEALIHCASHVLNKRPPGLKQLGITAQDDPHQLLPQARKLVKELDEGSYSLRVAVSNKDGIVRELTLPLRIVKPEPPKP